MTAFLFDLSFFLAAPFWLLMILAPRWHRTVRIARSPLTVLPILVVYLALAIPVLPELWATVSSPSLDGFRGLTALANGAGAIWAQVIAWDLLIGQWMFLEARRMSLHPLLMGPLLLFTILLSPIGMLVFLAVRAVHTARTARTAKATPIPGSDVSEYPVGP
ncbi:ABA4-like family protein [Streptomyces sp. NBC_00237]|uniref:ABA4-like family protein n=1 Tax=Streptomyces sp. NBC_00237 TaxID=2975687 RepID=UPI00225868D6|nr:ABA4-like family protein [Streptomyces sp. NBC_00237]MCX5202313.1 ABA4-like family protein [Streptomyces sp. NBC_00237]